MKRILIAAALAAPFLSFTVLSTNWKLDSSHAKLRFSITHLGINDVEGTFKTIDATITSTSEDLTKASVAFTADAKSIDTDSEMRDEHLRGTDFFDVAKYTTGTFKSTAWKKTGEDTFDVTGDLTLKGTTKPVTFKVKLLGFGDGMGGAKLSGWEVTGAIKKSEFGLAGPAMLSKALGDDVALNIGVEAVLKK